MAANAAYVPVPATAERVDGAEHHLTYHIGRLIIMNEDRKSAVRPAAAAAACAAASLG